uniref:Gelsolin-like domain-containing protein n=1 Tax=Panagrolaimus davidi TaxID=227884 RepID=A0A914P6J0_9BILA
MDDYENITDFEGAGTKEAIPSNEYGQFDETLTYICLQTHGKPPQSWDVYFWLGAESATDRHCLAALKATELDKYLKYRSNMHREVQDHESAAFLAMFKGQIR